MLGVLSWRTHVVSSSKQEEAQSDSDKSSASLGGLPGMGCQTGGAPSFSMESFEARLAGSHMPFALGMLLLERVEL